MSNKTIWRLLSGIDSNLSLLFTFEEENLKLLRVVYDGLYRDS